MAESGQPVRVGCSGWNYRDWRERVYPARLPARLWLAHYATLFDTVEVNATFYRLASPKAVTGWLEDTPEDFVFSVKASRYLTHMKRLKGMEQGVERFFAGIAPLLGTEKLGPVLWQLPERMQRDDERLEAALERLPTGRHAFEFRHPSWFCEPVYARLRAAGAVLVIGDHPSRPWQPTDVLTADWTYLRLHYGRRGRRGNYSATELDDWARRLAALAERAEAFVYFNNDWEGFAVRNALALRKRLEGARGGATNPSSGARLSSPPRGGAVR